MHANEFRRVLTTFADSPADLDLAKGRLLVQIRDEVIEASIRQREGMLFVKEDDEELPANRWLINRIARLHQLAGRILSYVEDVQHFVSPSGELVDQLERTETDAPQVVRDAARCVTEVLDRRPGGTSSVLYLTSDAGEGKTTLINRVARSQAQAYKRRETDWLLVPINMGGRPFLRFDDVVIGALVNRLRFQLFYYDAFIELVRMGVIVPAFDGFEEVFVESSSGEALSALGGLMNTLRSSGTVLVAARKAYFEYKSFATQAKLFDAIGSDAVAFARLGLLRWDREHFTQYALGRGIAQADTIYETVARRLTAKHPVLTRAVLVRRLLDVATSHAGLQPLLEDLGETPQDYFYQFVNAIVEREATEKWIDRTGNPAQQLLTTAEHHIMLSMVAQEMWLTSSEVLRGDVLDVIADVFTEAQSKSVVVSRQVRERIKQHALITTSDGGRAMFAFDHEDFRKFYLGEAVGRVLCSGNEGEVRGVLQVNVLPLATSDAAVQFVRRTRGTDTGPLVTLLERVGRTDLPSSFTSENAGALLVRLLDGSAAPAEGFVDVTGLSFPPDALEGRRLAGVRFKSCYFQETSVEGTSLTGCRFEECQFPSLLLSETTRVQDVCFQDCEVRSVSLVERDVRTFDPAGATRILVTAGIECVEEGSTLAAVPAVIAIEPDHDTRLVERALRLFLRATQINESMLRTRLGVRANHFLDHVLPELLQAGVLEEVQYAGAGKQRRFRLALPMREVDQNIQLSRGSFALFLERVSGGHGAGGG